MGCYTTLSHVPETLIFPLEILPSSKMKMEFVVITTCIGLLQTENKMCVCLCVYK